MRLATWNVNSLKVRMARVEEWLEMFQPDVVCLQETKLKDTAFPALAFSGLGYEAAHHGLGQWNGVAILSRVGLEKVRTTLDGADPALSEGRFLSAYCGGLTVVSVYVPNGRSLESEHYEAKLTWLGALADHLEAVARPNEPLAVCGDFNIAPQDRDVWDPGAFVGSTHVSEEERTALRRLLDWGLVDAFRERFPQSGIFSWWDYRAGDFHKGHGMRIDLVLLTRAVAGDVSGALIDRNARKGRQPSDHAPVVVDVGGPWS